MRAWAARHKVRLCFTPTSASWANPIEAQFGPLRTFVMGNSDHPHYAALTRRTELGEFRQPPVDLLPAGRFGLVSLGTQAR